MDWKLFFSTFLMIFLAELGDKTQLTAMARSVAGRWTVFFAASAALVVSTLLAVLFGSVLSKVVPEVYIRVAAAVVFLLFGGMILYDVFAAGRKPEAAPAPVEQTFLTHAVLELAATFEARAVADYRRHAETEPDPARRALYHSLAEAEEAHLQHLRTADVPVLHREAPICAQTVPPETLHQQAVPDAERDAILAEAIRHEEALAGFYGEMARVMHVPGVGRLFALLAEEELAHAASLRTLLASH